MDIKDPSRFRLWVHRLWQENCEENLTFGVEPYKMQEYWDRYKWWIRREYKFQKDKNV